MTLILNGLNLVDTKIELVRSSLENCTSNNTRQHEATRVQHETTQHNTTRVQHNATRHNTSTARHNTTQCEYNTTQHEQNTRQHEYNAIQREYSTTHEYKGTSSSKNRALIVLFVTELYFFLISFRNS